MACALDFDEIEAASESCYSSAIGVSTVMFFIWAVLPYRSLVRERGSRGSHYDYPVKEVRCDQSFGNMTSARSERVDGVGREDHFG
jgi:hypothetical protein